MLAGVFLGHGRLEVAEVRVGHESGGVVAAVADASALGAEVHNDGSQILKHGGNCNIS